MSNHITVSPARKDIVLEMVILKRCAVIEDNVIWRLHTWMLPRIDLTKDTWT